MEREKFMQEARIAAHRILEGKENGIMNLVQQAWAEGKRNAEVETLKQAVVEAFCNGSATIDESHNVGYVEPTYTTWGEYLCNIGLIHDKGQNMSRTNIEMNLMPCPFCGGEAKLQSNMWPRFVYCTSCYSRTANCTTFGTEEGSRQAVNAWNRRTEQTEN